MSQDIEKIIKDHRPDVSMSTVRTYRSILVNLAKKIGFELKSPNDIKTHIKDIVAHLKNVPPKSRKTSLSALVVFYDSPHHDKHIMENLKLRMMKDKTIADGDDEKQEMNEKQRSNWLSWEELLSTYKTLEKEVSPLFKVKGELKKLQFHRLQLYVLLSCLFLIAPRRSTDYTNFYLRNYEEKKNEVNYMDKSKFIFNSFKTVKKLGQQIVEIPPKLRQIITKWSDINKADTLLVDSNGHPMNSTKLTSLLYNFFEKKVSINMIRHAYLTHCYGDIPALEDMNKKAQNMGQSDITQALKYVKK